MANYILCFCLLRIILPICLIASVIIRPVGFSFLYLLLMFYLPFVPVPTQKTFKGHAGHYLRAVLCISVLTMTLQLAWQITLVSIPTSWAESWLSKCGLIEAILRHVGLVPYEHLDVTTVLTWISPEILMFISSIAIYIITKVLCKGLPEDELQSSAPKRKNSFVVNVGKYICLLMLMISGCLQPSVLSGIYYITFLGGATWWACGKELARGFAIICKFIMAIMFCHVVVLFAYQTQWILDLLPPEDVIARFLGLTQLINMNCSTDPRLLEYLPLEWASFVSPVSFVLSFYLMAFESSALLEPQVTSSLEAPHSTEATPLIRAVSPTRKLASRRSNASSSIYYQDSTGSVTVAPEEGIPMQTFDEPVEENEAPTILEHIMFTVIAIFQMMIRTSYIATAIIMMAWSITYHSWLTFVFLLWANVVWMVENQRGFTLRSSPFLVAYAQLLLLAQYIYGMNLKEDELPTQVQGMNMAQIGFERVDELRCKPLFIKSLYTIMFWVTLRQLAQEKRERRQSSAIADMVAPLQITVGTATTVLDQDPNMQTSPVLKKLGEFLKSFLTKFWICVVASMLFLIGITGQRMTVFRIIYMALFLIFIITFQISRQIWRKMMYVFWLTVIVYSMSILIMVYTYQFDNFPKYWEEYLHISEKLQLDIGLERYNTKELFLRLLLPTLFLILTVIQLHYFHTDFLAISHIKSRSSSVGRQDSQGPHSIASSMMGGSSLPPSTPLDKKVSVSLEVGSELKALEAELSTKSQHLQGSPSHTAGPSASVDFATWLARVQKIAFDFFSTAVDLIFLFLELHLIKIIMLSIMLLCVYDVCAIHLAFVIIVCISLLFNTKIQVVIIQLISTVTCILLLLKMIYQIEYIEHASYDVNCPFKNSTSENMTTYNVTLNNAKWLGFRKTSDTVSLPKLLKGYIGLIIVITIRSIVDFRQCYKRYIANDPTIRPHLMFPKIGRLHADKDVKHFFQYLFNFGFYKFGVEICLLCLVALIGSRMDAWAVLYSGWLCVLWCSSRERLARLWHWFVGFIVTALPIQYLTVVGLLPGLCVTYPWTGSEKILVSTRNWFMLPDPVDPPYAAKLMCDFLLLLFCSRQSLVFRIERRHGDGYKGGSNSDEIPEDWESQDFINPVPDFVTYIRSWLDVIKRITMLGSLWVTLAIMFLTGTNRVNLFSLGYLIGSFIFLWQGTDLYLRPIKSTLKWWNWLLGYNVAVIVVKTLLQIVGCIFINDMQREACWLVQLLGIGCIDKFADGSIRGFFKMSRTFDHECSVPREDIGLAWDGVCFGFLLLQRRLFQSHYFLRIIDESKAITILQSRGAELIEELRLKQMKLQDEQEKKILEKIKVKMDRIKANQQKIQGPAYKEPSSHFVAIRSGDYYMFDEFDDDDELDLIAEKESDESDDGIDKKLTLGQLLSSAMKTDIGRATEMRRGSVPPPLPRTRLSTRSARSRHSARRDSAICESPETMDKADPEHVKVSVKDGEDGEDDDDYDHSDRPLESIKLGTEPLEQETWWNKLCKYVLFAWAFVESFLISLTRYLNKFSRDYRYVAKVLTREKILLKERPDFGIGIRSGSTQTWEPLPSTLMRLKKPQLSEASEDARVCDQQKLESAGQPAAAAKASDSTTPIEEYDDETFASDQPPIFRFLFAVWYAIIAHTDIVCYFMIFVNQIQSATVLSLPLPLMVFLWGTLSIPRPTKTFWVTIIAYTEVIVLIKCMFQYEILPWNQNVIPNNMPFSAPRIIGIERKKNYALYDLILLLIVFFHRFMLISLGLWKSTAASDVVEDGIYAVSPSQLTQFKDGQTMSIGQMFAKKQAERLEAKKSEEENAVTLSIKSDSSDQDGIETVCEISQKNSVTSSPEKKPSEKSDNLNDKDPTDHSAGSSEQPADTERIDDKTTQPLEYMQALQVSTTPEDQFKNFPGVVKLSTMKYGEPIRQFYARMLNPTSRVKADVYAYMFMCDFFNFMVVIFGFSAFGTQQGDGGVQAYLEENKVPIPFLVMLILQFGLIVIDRALFLRKFILGKMLFQICLIIGVHVWMFFILPGVTERSFNALPPPPLWYMVKCIYLLLSAYQIRCGYPTRILGNFLCKGYNYVNMFLFKGFMAIPFLFELRALMDWIWTDTSMTVSEWLKMEDIFANIFQLKCSRHVEDEYPQPRGGKKKAISKYLMGGSALAFIIALIWFPLVLFAFGNTVGESNPPYDVTVEIRMGPYLPIYVMSAKSNNIEIFSEDKWETLSNIYKKDRTAQTFLSNYIYDDLAAVILNGNSTSVWGISPPDIERLRLDALSNDTLNIKLKYVLSHKTNSKDNPSTITEEIDVEMKPFIDGKRNPQRTLLVEMLSEKNSSDWIMLENLFPKFIKVFNKGTSKTVHQLMREDPKREKDNILRNISLKLTYDKSLMWWEVKEDCFDENFNISLAHIPYQNCEQLVMYTFSEKLFPATLNFISGSGIIGLYTTFVFLASRMLRGYFSGICNKIMFDDLPNVDRVLQLCLDIYLVRESGELSLEEDLFAKLVFLYRSPETMIKWSRPKDEDEQDDDETQRH